MNRASGRKAKRIALGLVFAGVLVMGSMACAPTPEVFAADIPVDGIWFIQETGPGIGPSTFYASVHQSGSTVVAILVSLDGEWIYVVGSRSGAIVQGPVYTPDGAAYGSFRVTVTSATTLTGSSTTQGITTPLVGTKVF